MRALPEPVRRARSALTGRVDSLVLERATTLLGRRRLAEHLRPAADRISARAVDDLVTALGADLPTPAQHAQALAVLSAGLGSVDVHEPDDATVAELCSLFTRLWEPGPQPVAEPAAPILDAIRDQFHRLYYHVSDRTWQDTYYRGVLTYKCPTDMWVYQELIDTVRPGLVVETGTFRGGSALFLADRLETAGHGAVVTIDIEARPDLPEHPRLTYLTGSSVDPAVLEQVFAMAPAGEPVLVILDADHREPHVSAELRAYAPLVTVGSYLVVEDTNVNGHPASPGWGPGPYEAVQDFLATGPGFEVDARCERYYLTQNPSGYLRRTR